MRSTAWCGASRSRLSKGTGRWREQTQNRIKISDFVRFCVSSRGAGDPATVAVLRYGTMIECSKPEATQPTPIC